MSANAHELFRGFSFVAPQLIEDMSLNSRVATTKSILSAQSERKVLSSGINATGWVRSLKDFDILEELGKGSFSKCCRCIHRESGKQYAIKVKR